MVVAKDIKPGRDSDPMHRRVDASAWENVVDAGGDGASSNVLVPDAEAAFGWPDTLGESLNPGPAPSSERLADCQYIRWRLSQPQYKYPLPN